MSTLHRNAGKSSGIPVAEEEVDPSDRRRDVTITRLRMAILQDKSSVVSSGVESCGSDPYNSGVHRALAKKNDPWDKR
ncbi:MAG: hypothetical protein WDO12_12720 [Pseudomonadota bacterium]